jgi:hypothetical protein
MTALILIAGIVWGSLSAQFLVQTITSLIIASISLAGLAFSKVPKDMNAAGCIAALAQAAIFAVLFFGGNWFASGYIDFASWNAASIASLVAFVSTLIYCALQVPGKILLARLSAWAPFFVQAAMGRPRNERVSLAKEYRASPTMDTLYPSRPPEMKPIARIEGSTPETAIRIRAANSVEGIPKEYAALSAMFGKRNKDWKLIDRTLIHADDGRKQEKFIVSASNKRQEVYFDITDFMKGNDEKAKASLDKIIAGHDVALDILLPKEEFMTLQMGVLNLSEAQLRQLGLSAEDRKQMLDPLLDTLSTLSQRYGKDYESIPAHVTVTMMTSAWSKIMGLLTSWQPTELQEEELENLKAIIGGSMKAALLR